uniref:Uncharacterized protein n=1 Tax=Zooxanthella nutricula TaxID=1333877 RepID=A0A7S2PVG4_9DINO|mmetsp:Transcript_69901/g.214409  ORF Transcript_69901/g.214409 Transcript_69901/m.214409 type:complete len:191 (+) Transcript_69901:1-573(+)
MERIAGDGGDAGGGAGGEAGEEQAELERRRSRCQSLPPMLHGRLVRCDATCRPESDLAKRRRTSWRLRQGVEVAAPFPGGPLRIETWREQPQAAAKDGDRQESDSIRQESHSDAWLAELRPHRWPLVAACLAGVQQFLEDLVHESQVRPMDVRARQKAVDGVLSPAEAEALSPLAAAVIGRMSRFGAAGA